MNGNIRTCYEYYSSIGNEEMKSKYNNSIAEGSENNPYALEDALDWCNIPYVGFDETGTKLYPYFEVVKDIDMNDCNVQTIDSCIIADQNFSFTKIEGNGYSIRNLSAILQNVVSASDTFMMKNITKGIDPTSTINNLNFINIIRYDSFTHLFNTGNYYMTLVFNNCNFTVYDFNRNGTVTNSRSHHGFLTEYGSMNCICNYCTFNVKTSLMFHDVFANPGMSRSSQNIINDDLDTVYNYCHINIEYMHGINPTGLINPGKYNFSYITLTINYLGQDDTTGNNAYNLFSDNATTTKFYNFRGSYIYIKFKSNSTINNPYLKFGVVNALPTSSASSTFTKIINSTPIPSFITIEDENKDDPDKAINIDDFMLYTPADISDEGVYAIGSPSSTLYYLTPENAKNYDILAKMDFPCLQV